MLQCVRKMGYSGNLLQAVSSTYVNNQSAVMEAGTEKPESYAVKDGLREGAVLSPMLYTFVASLITELKKPEHRKLGMHIGDIWAGARMAL
jgi:hypothetical protein